MIKPDEVGELLIELAESDLVAAELKVDVERQDFALKRIKAAQFICSEGSVEHRKALARTSDKYVAQESRYLDSFLASEALNNKRKTWALMIEIYRTQSANRRMA